MRKLSNGEIGKNIQELRTYYGISQKKLADGICTQAMISIIEKNEDTYISAQLLYQIAERLGVDINYFFTKSETPKLGYIEEVCYQIRLLVRQGQFKEAKKMIKIEQKSPLFRSHPLKQFLKWQEGLCIFYLTRDYEKSVLFLEEAISMANTTEKNSSESQIEIMISLAIIHSEKRNYKLANENYERALILVRQLPIIKNEMIEARLYYNYSKCLHEQKEYKKSFQLAEQGIRYCKSKMSLYLIGELYYQKGESLLYLEGNINKVIEYMEKALWYFKELENHTFYDYVSNEVDKLKDLKQNLSSIEYIKG